MIKIINKWINKEILIIELYKKIIILLNILIYWYNILVKLY